MHTYNNDTPDRPDLNLCPECESFFDPAAENCPICGAFCPEEMRAGHRAVKKQKKNASPWKQNRGSSRVVFVEWYHSWWFIILALIFMPVAGIILLLTSPHKTSHKVAIVAVGVVYTMISSVGIGNLIGRVTGMFDKPIDTSLSEPAYIEACIETDTEAFYRMPDAYLDRFTSLSLTVEKKFSDPDALYSGDKYAVYYLCTDETGAFRILVRDCTALTGDTQNFIPGDVITVYGEGAGNVSVYDEEYNLLSAPCIHMAFGELE